jgi:hypothetical protein
MNYQERFRIIREHLARRQARRAPMPQAERSELLEVARRSIARRVRKECLSEGKGMSEAVELENAVLALGDESITELVNRTTSA